MVNPYRMFYQSYHIGIVMKLVNGKVTIKLDKMLKIVRLLSAKLCHDMASPINSSYCALDILSKSDLASDESQKQLALSIITDSTKDSVSRIIFLRSAYSHITSNILESALECKEEIQNFLKRKQIEVRVVTTEDVRTVNIDANVKQILYNCIIVMTEMSLSIKELVIEIKDSQSITIIAMNHGSDMEYGSLTSLGLLNNFSQEIEPGIDNIQPFWTSLLIQQSALLFKASNNKKELKLEIHPPIDNK